MRDKPRRTLTSPSKSAVKFPQNATTISTTSPSTTSITTGPITTPALAPFAAALTPCSGTLSGYEIFGPKVLATLSSAEQSGILSFSLAVYSIYSSLAILNRNYERLMASSSAGPSLLTSLYNVVQSDATAIFGTDAYAYFAFGDITDACLRETCFNQLIAESSAFEPHSSTALFYYTAQPPCCGQCTVSARAVQLEYWPTPALQPPVSTLIDVAHNFTLYVYRRGSSPLLTPYSVSPSAYAAFTALGASNKCGLVGKSHPLTTIAFDDGELSSTNFPQDPNAPPVFTTLWTAINFADFGE